ncbi:hypothetical protein BDR07DRAFT_1398565, partial [Suillus spraguei]
MHRICPQPPSTHTCSSSACKKCAPPRSMLWSTAYIPETPHNMQTRCESLQEVDSSKLRKSLLCGRSIQFIRVEFGGQFGGRFGCRFG